MGLLENSNKKEQTKQKEQAATTEKVVEEESSEFSDKNIEDWLFNQNSHIEDKRITMVLGEDGTGKTGLVLDEIARELRNDETKYAIVLDLDGGSQPLLKHHNDVKERLIVKDPMIVKKDKNHVEIDFESTMYKIKATADWVARNYQNYNITAFVFDGLSTLLKHAEKQMRLEKNIAVDGGVQMQFWKKRNDDFENVLDVIKTIPINSYFIGHTDFIISSDSANIKIKTNAMMHQRIITRRVPGVNDGEVKLEATISKSKNNPLKENQQVTFMSLEDGVLSFDSSEIFKDL